jgi:hypothetical protein
MRGLLPAIVVLAVASLSAGPATAADQRCLMFSGTADALSKPAAVEGSRTSLQDAIAKWKTENHVEVYQAKAAKPDPHPYWRSAIFPELFLAPDEITDQAYTICWKGVVSPVVCTSGAEVCW